MTLTRHGVARLVEMHAPVSIVTPNVERMPNSENRTKEFLARAYQKLPFALPSSIAQKQISDRAEKFADNLFKEVAKEATTAKRRLR